MSHSSAIALEIQRIVGHENTLSGSACEPYAVDGQVPLAVAHPETPSQIQEILSLASKANSAVTPWGQGTQMPLGNQAQFHELVLSLARFDQIVEFVPTDLTVTAQAGCPLQALQEQLAAENLFLPVDPAHAEQTTLGGMVAANANGPHRLRHNNLRDLVLGLRVILADGTPINVGGRTVKNVAGYDLTKLFIGSFGTLGVITEITFRLLPLPEVSRTVVVCAEECATAFALCRRLLDSELLPTALEIVNPAGAKALGYEKALLIVDFEDFAEAAERQVAQLSAWCKAGTIAVETLHQEARQQLWRTIRDWSMGDIACRVQVPLAESQACLQFLEDQIPEVQVVVHAGAGIVCARYVSQEGTFEAERLKRIQEYAWQRGGVCVVERAPVLLKPHLDIWGYDRPDVEFMRMIKSRFDMKGILNPGRFVGGI